jgi:hypothetical protein
MHITSFIFLTQRSHTRMISKMTVKPVFFMFFLHPTEYSLRKLLLLLLLLL